MRRRPTKDRSRQLETFSTTIKRRAISLLGHIIRLPDNDPLKQITLRKEKPLYQAAKRVGRPKLNWAKQTFHAAWETAKTLNPATPSTTFTASAEQYDNLIRLAKFRRPPFNTKNSNIDSEASSLGPQTTSPGVSSLGPHTTSLFGARPQGPHTTRAPDIGVSSLGPHTTRSGESSLGPHTTNANGTGPQGPLTSFVAGAPLAVLWST